MNTPEKPTMADMSGEKRDRNSANTDQPVSTTNTKDAKMQCSDDKAPLAKQNDAETIENGKNPKDPDTKRHTEDDIIDVDSLISSGGLEKDSDAPNDTFRPQKLFDEVEDVTDDDDDDDDHDHNHNGKKNDDDSLFLATNGLSFHSNPSSTNAKNNPTTNKQTDIKKNKK